jgi:predicted transcriptional regulator
MVTLKNLSISHVYLYGVTEAVIEAVKSGLCPVIVCVDDEIPNLTRKLGEENIDYEIVDVKKV